MSEPPNQESPPPRVRLRVVVGILLVMGMAGGWWAMNRQKGLKQANAIRALRQLGCAVYLDYQWHDDHPLPGTKPPEARWVRTLFGDAALRRALAVDARNVTDLDTALDNLKWLPYLQYLDLAGTPLTDAHAAALHKAHGLLSLDLSDTRLTDDGMADIASLRQLVTLSLAGTQVSGRSVFGLAQMSTLRTLDLSRTRFDRDSLRLLQTQLPKCKIMLTP